MEFLNNPQNRDIRKVIDNYVNNVNFEFDGNRKISFKYYISQTLTFEFNLEFYNFNLVFESKDDECHYLEIKVYLQKDFISEYVIVLNILNSNIVTFKYHPKHSHCNICYGSMILKMDYQINKDGIDKFLKFIHKSEEDSSPDDLIYY